MTDKRENIIHTAIQLFAERGFDGTSVRDIAAKADVNIAMINYYFGSKDKLFAAMVDYKSTYFREQLEAISQDESKDEIEKIDAIVEKYVNRFFQEQEYHRVLHQELMLQQREDLHETIVLIFKKNKDTVTSLIKKGIEKKLFRTVDPDLSMMSMMGTINQVLLSKTMCRMVLNSGKEFDPVKDPAFKLRLITHIQQLMRSHLLINKPQ